MNIDRELFEKNAAYTRNALVVASAVFKDGDFRQPGYLLKIVKDGLERGQNQKQQGMESWKDQIAREKKVSPLKNDLKIRTGAPQARQTIKSSR